MKINMNIKRRFKFNGKEYNSIDEMPDSIRETFKKAMGSQAASEYGINHTAMKTKITFNGTEYESVDAMPQDVRQLYEEILKSAENGTAPPGIDIAGIGSGVMKESGMSGNVPTGNNRRPGKAEPSFSARALVVSIGLIALILLFYYLFRSR
jgi:hypothetical protein